MVRSTRKRQHVLSRFFWPIVIKACLRQSYFVLPWHRKMWWTTQSARDRQKMLTFYSTSCFLHSTWHTLCCRIGGNDEARKVETKSLLNSLLICKCACFVDIREYPKEITKPHNRSDEQTSSQHFNNVNQGHTFVEFFPNVNCFEICASECHIVNHTHFVFLQTFLYVLSDIFIPRGALSRAHPCTKSASLLKKRGRFQLFRSLQLCCLLFWLVQESKGKAYFDSDLGE